MIIKKFKEIVHSYNIRKNEALTQKFFEACSYGNLEQVKKLLLDKKVDINWPFGKPLYLAMLNKNTEVVQYLLSSPDLKEHADFSKSFKFACRNGGCESLKVIEAMFSSRYSRYWDADANIGDGLYVSCLNKNWEVAEYFLKVMSAKQEKTVQPNFDKAFIEVCSDEKFSLAERFILELNIKRTNTIDEFLNEVPNERIERMFTIRDLNQKLEKELPLNDNVSKQPKRLKL